MHVSALLLLLLSILSQIYTQETHVLSLSYRVQGHLINVAFLDHLA